MSPPGATGPAAPTNVPFATFRTNGPVGSNSSQTVHGSDPATNVVHLTQKKPIAIKPNFDGFPLELQALRNWVMWRYEPPDRPTQKWQKVPYQVKGLKASTTNRRTWNTFDACRAAYERGSFDGVGFVFDKTLLGPDGLCYFGADFDKCITDDEIAPQTKKQINTLDTYTEISVSGTGMHCIGRGKPLDRSVKATASKSTIPHDILPSPAKEPDKSEPPQTKFAHSLQKFKPRKQKTDARLIHPRTPKSHRGLLISTPA